MKFGLAILVLSIIFGVCVGRNVSSVQQEGYEITYLDYPSYIHDLRYNDAVGRFYIYGDGVFREVDYTTTSLKAVDNFHLYNYSHHFIDERLFSKTDGGNDLYVVGITASPSNQNPPSNGFYLPLIAIGPHGYFAHVQHENREQYSFYGLTVDHRDFAKVRVYLAGWYTNNITAALEFVVVRAHIDLNNPATGTFTWDEAVDRVTLFEGNYRPYHSTFKPRLIVDWTNHFVYVVDPGTETIYRVVAPEDEKAKITLDKSVDFRAQAGLHRDALTSANWHFYTDMLYVGFAGTGEFNGTMYEVNLKDMTIGRHFEFPAWYSNPRVIVGRNESAIIYIAFEGGPAVVKFDTQGWKILGYARLPPGLVTVYTGWEQDIDHVIFATNDQHSKVFGIHKNNFCPADCPYNGFCISGACQCITDYKLTDGRCDPVPTTHQDILDDTNNGAAIALGILFALTTIAAVVGWFMFYRARKGAYTRVL